MMEIIKRRLFQHYAMSSLLFRQKQTNSKTFLHILDQIEIYYTMFKLQCALTILVWVMTQMSINKQISGMVKEYVRRE